MKGKLSHRLLIKLWEGQEIFLSAHACGFACSYYSWFFFFFFFLGKKKKKKKKKTVSQNLEEKKLTLQKAPLNYGGYETADDSHFTILFTHKVLIINLLSLFFFFF